MKRSLRRIRLFGIVVILGMSLAIWHFVLTPRYEEPASIRAQVAAQLSAAGASKAQTLDLQAKLQHIDTAKAEAATLATQMPEVAGGADLYLQLNAVANSVGMHSAQVQSIVSSPLATDATGMPDTAAATKGVTLAPLAVYVMTVSITVTGSLDQLCNFTDALYASPRALVIDGISVTPSAGNVKSGASGAYIATITARAFTVKSITVAPDVKSISARLDAIAPPKK